MCSPSGSLDETENASRHGSELRAAACNRSFKSSPENKVEVKNLHGHHPNTSVKESGTYVGGNDSNQT